MKQWLALVLVAGTLTGCGKALSPALPAPGVTARIVQPAAGAGQLQARAAATVELKATGKKGNGYTFSYALFVSKGGHKVEYTFDDTPMLEEDTSPARISNGVVKYDGKRISLNDEKAVDAALAVLRGSDAMVDDDKQKMVRTAIAALVYD